MARKKKSTNLLNALLYIAVGILFCFGGMAALDLILMIAGVIFIVVGIIDLVRQNWGSGIVSLVIGAVILLGA